MDLRFTPEENAFRDEVRTFFKANLPENIRRKSAEGIRYIKDDIVTWQRILNRQGWAVPHWPKEWGGTGWSPVQQYIFLEEMQLAPSARAARLRRQHGRAGAHRVRRARSRSATSCRASPTSTTGGARASPSPASGSDLASLKTTAKRDGDHYVVNGQKTWTTSAQYADWIFCLVRTDSSAKKQEGISFLLIDMKTPGITVRPIQTIDGGYEVNEVFFDDVRVPVENRIGEENKGWDYAKFLLGNERTGIARVGISKAQGAAAEGDRRARKRSATSR